MIKAKNVRVGDILNDYTPNGAHFAKGKVVGIGYVNEPLFTVDGWVLVRVVISGPGADLKVGSYDVIELATCKRVKRKKAAK